MEPLTSKVGIAIENVRRRIRQYRDREKNPCIGEQNTKAALIDPLLVALGWDLQEIDEVRREYRRKPQDNPVDYALFLNRTECLLIEAKSLEKDLGDRRWISQNISYAAVVGVKWCVLTNGDEYRIYNSHAEVDVDEKLFRKMSVSETEPKFLTDTLALLSKDEMRGSLLDEMWKAHFIDRRVRHAFETLLGEEGDAFITALCKNANGVTPSEARASLKRAKIMIDFPVPDTFQRAPVPSPRTERATPLGFEPVAALPEVAKRTRKTVGFAGNATLSGLIAAGYVKAPMEIERTYKSVRLTALVQSDGSVLFMGETGASLSTAGGLARKSVLGTPQADPPPATNGWSFWQFRDLRTGSLREMDSLRQEFRAGAK